MIKQILSQWNFIIQCAFTLALTNEFNFERIKSSFFVSFFAHFSLSQQEFDTSAGSVKYHRKIYHRENRQSIIIIRALSVNFIPLKPRWNPDWKFNKTTDWFSLKTDFSNLAPCNSFTTKGKVYLLFYLLYR